MLLLLAAACTFVTDEEWAARGELCDPTGYYLDLDGDGYGYQAVRDCSELGSAIRRAGDCDDADAAANPGADEVHYDGADQNCDGSDDYDADGDGYASAAFGGDDCFDIVTDAVPAASGDCELPSDDIAPDRIYPGALDIPYDGVDADCSGGSDFDADGDGYPSCDECADADEAVNPAATEVWYDGVDQNCDLNDGDQDGDGYYEQGYEGSVPSPWLPGDCDDLDAAVSPGETEAYYDGVDADCLGDDDYDHDHDGHRSAAEPDELGQVGDDCDDDDDTRSPSAAEECATTRDDDCDGDNNDVGATDCESWYVDDDGDARGDPATAACTCTGTATHTVLDATDCDDTDPDVGMLTWYADADLDGYGVPSGTTTGCTAPAGYAATDDDCDDAEATTWPGAAEACDAVDSDCDGEVNDAEVLSACTTTWYVDGDGDGYGGEGLCLCASEGAYTTATGGDCDDADVSVSPAAAEVCNDGIDGDCDDAPGACSFEGTRDTTDADLVWLGPTSLDAAASALAAAGDLDGDGLDELLLAATGYDGGGTTNGVVSVLRPGVDTAVDGGWAGVTNTDASVDFAATLLAPGDLDGDGVGDVLVGVPDPTDPADGRVLRYGNLGGAYLSSGAADLAVWSHDSSAEVGWSLAAAGDVDGDGNGDLLIGSPYDISYSGGRVSLVPGNLTGTWMIDDALTELVTGMPDARYGYRVGAGDVDGDGLADVFVGAPLEDASTSDDGAVYGYVGGFTASFQVMKLYPGQPSAWVGSVAPLVADVDADGYGDVVIASPEVATVWVVPGSVTGDNLLGDVDYATLSGASGTDFGEALSAGDLDADGAAELVVGDGGGQAVYVFAGPLAPGALGVGDAAAVITGAGHEEFGASLAVLADADGDGVGDLVIGASGDDTAATDAGAAWFFAGGGY